MMVVNLSKSQYAFKRHEMLFPIKHKKIIFNGQIEFHEDIYQYLLLDLIISGVAVPSVKIDTRESAYDIRIYAWG